MKKRLTFRHRLVCALPYSLIHFLIYYKCLNQFINNACDINIGGQDKSLLEDLENSRIDHDDIIYEAFIWTKSLEDYNFWYRRSMWYKQYLQNLKNKQ